MTKQLYFSSDQLSEDAVVRACVAVTNGYEVILDRTIFHPQGGGQPSDVGYMGDARVTKVISRKGEIVHCMETPVNERETRLSVDFDTRLLHSRLHTAGHLIGHVLTSLGFTAANAHHWPGDSRIDAFANSDNETSFLSLTHLQEKINSLITINLPRITRIHGSHREIGFGEFYSFPCGGTHVASTSLVDRCTIENISNREKGLRIRYTV